MRGEGAFSRDGVNYETACMWGDALMYKVRFQESPRQWGGWHAFADDESRQDLIKQWFEHHAIPERN